LPQNDHIVFDEIRKHSCHKDDTARIFGRRRPFL